MLLCHRPDQQCPGYPCHWWNGGWQSHLGVLQTQLHHQCIVVQGHSPSCIIHRCLTQRQLRCTTIAPHVQMINAAAGNVVYSPVCPPVLQVLCSQHPTPVHQLSPSVVLCCQDASGSVLRRLRCVHVARHHERPFTPLKRRYRRRQSTQHLAPPVRVWRQVDCDDMHRLRVGPHYANCQYVSFHTQCLYCCGHSLQVQVLPHHDSHPRAHNALVVCRMPRMVSLRHCFTDQVVATCLAMHLSFSQDTYVRAYLVDDLPHLNGRAFEASSVKTHNS